MLAQPTDGNFRLTDNTPRALYFAFRNHVSGERGPLSWSKQCHALVLSPFKKRSGVHVGDKNATRRIRSFRKANTAEQVLKTGVIPNRIKEGVDFEELQDI